MSLTLILTQDYLTWKHANIILSGQVDLSINGSANMVSQLPRIGRRLVRRIPGCAGHRQSQRRPQALSRRSGGLWLATIRRGISSPRSSSAQLRAACRGCRSVLAGWLPSPDPRRGIAPGSAFRFVSQWSRRAPSGPNPALHLMTAAPAVLAIRESLGRQS